MCVFFAFTICKFPLWVTQADKNLVVNAWCVTYHFFSALLLGSWLQQNKGHWHWLTGNGSFWVHRFLHSFSYGNRGSYIGSYGFLHRFLQQAMSKQKMKIHNFFNGKYRNFAYCVHNFFLDKKGFTPHATQIWTAKSILKILHNKELYTSNGHWLEGKIYVEHLCFQHRRL